MGKERSKKEILGILRENSHGLTLVEIGNEMGVNWRSLVETMNVLMDEGGIERLGDVYYLSGDEM
jgi:predicted transcriptional regulator